MDSNESAEEVEGVSISGAMARVETRKSFREKGEICTVIFLSETT